MSENIEHINEAEESAKNKIGDKKNPISYKTKIWISILAYFAILTGLSFYYRIWWDWTGFKVGCGIVLSIIPVIPFIYLAIFPETRWSEEERIRKRKIGGKVIYDKGPTIKYKWLVKVAILFFLLSLIPEIAQILPEKIMSSTGDIANWVNNAQPIIGFVYILLFGVAVYIDKEDPTGDNIKWTIVIGLALIPLIFGISAWMLIGRAISTIPKSIYPAGYLFLISPYAFSLFIYWWKGHFRHIGLGANAIHLIGYGTKKNPNIILTKGEFEIKSMFGDSFEKIVLRVMTVEITFKQNAGEGKIEERTVKIATDKSKELYDLIQNLRSIMETTS